MASFKRHVRTTLPPIALAAAAAALIPAAASPHGGPTAVNVADTSSPCPSGTSSPTASPSATSSASASATSSPSVTPSDSATATTSPSATPSDSATATASPTGSTSPTACTPTISDVSQPNKTAGQPVTLSGTAEPNSTVDVFYRNATTGSGFSLLKSTTANATGGWSVTFTPAYSSDYQVTSNGQTSAVRTVNVTVKVTIDDIRYLGKDARGRCVTRFLGGTYPYIPGAPVWVRNSRTTPSQPIGYTQVFRYGGSGRYDARFGLTCGQTYRLFSLISGQGSDGKRYTDNGVGENNWYTGGH